MVKRYKFLIRSSEAKRPFGRYKRKYGNNIKTNLYKTLFDDVRYIELVPDRIN